MPIIRAQVVLHTKNNLVEDFITNTWYGDTGGPQGNIDFANALYQFYIGIGNWMSYSLAMTGHEVKMYDMDDAEPRVPVFAGTFNFVDALSTTMAPSEVAVCLSFQAEPQSGMNQARRRGRVFLGPWSAGIVDGSARPSTTLIDEIVLHANTFRTQAISDATWNWVVFSTASFNPQTGAGAAVSNVTNGWVDNAFDTQRRRGIAPTARVIFPPP